MCEIVCPSIFLCFQSLPFSTFLAFSIYISVCLPVSFAPPPPPPPKKKKKKRKTSPYTHISPYLLSLSQSLFLLTTPNTFLSQRFFFQNDITQSMRETYTSLYQESLNLYHFILLDSVSLKSIDYPNLLTCF